MMKAVRDTLVFEEKYHCYVTNSREETIFVTLSLD